MDCIGHGVEKSWTQLSDSLSTTKTYPFNVTDFPFSVIPKPGPSQSCLLDPVFFFFHSSNLLTY